MNLLKSLNELKAVPKEVDSFRKDVAGIDTVDTRDDSWRQNLGTYFSKHGFTILGRGKYASVFGSPKYKFVIKIFMKDAAFMKWLKFCRENQNNKYVPKLRGKVIKISDLFYAIRMERLSVVSGGSSTQDFMSEYGKWSRNPSSYSHSDKDLVDMFEYFGEYTSILDIHYENIMRRGTQVVVIDPFYNWFGRKAPGQYTIDPDDIDQDLF